MTFKFCRYCETIEGDMSLMGYHVDKKGKIIYEDIHESCKSKEIENPKKDDVKSNNKTKKFIGIKCKFCGVFESDESKLYIYIDKNDKKYVRNIHLNCKDIRDNKSYEIKKEKDRLRMKVNNEEKRIKKNIVDRILETPERKICTKCDDEKHISEFYQNRDMSYYSYCKKCHYALQKKYKEKNKEKIRNYLKIYRSGYELNDKQKEKRKLYYKEKYHKIKEKLGIKTNNNRGRKKKFPELENLEKKEYIKKVNKERYSLPENKQKAKDYYQKKKEEKLKNNNQPKN